MDTSIEARKKAKGIAEKHFQSGDATGWFEELYEFAAGDSAAIPWAHLKPNPELTEWADRERLSGAGKTALVIACGLGDDAEDFARRGFAVTAFDIAPSAIAWAKRRFPESKVDYQVADLLQLPEIWNKRFDFVLESYTIQALPGDAAIADGAFSPLRRTAIGCVARTVAAGGQLLVLCRGRDEIDPVGTLPWPLTRRELSSFSEEGLTELSFEDYTDAEDSPARRFRVLYGR